MEMDGSILEHIRDSVGLTKDNEEFDTELINHINMSIVKMHQNGVPINKFRITKDTTWGDLLTDPQAVVSSEHIGLIPTFMSLNVKLLFDPPPPSSVEFHVRSMDELLWRLKIAYE